MIEPEYIFYFLKDSMSKWRQVDQTHLWKWFYWHWKNAEVQAFIDHGKVKGVIVGRRISDLGESQRPYFVNLSGDVLFIDQAAVEGISLFDLVNEALPHFTWVNSVIFQRNGDGKYRHLKLSKLVRKLSRSMNYGRR